MCDTDVLTDTGVLILSFWPWWVDIDIDILTLVYWHWHADTGVLTPVCWHWCVDTSILTLVCWHWRSDIDVLTPVCWHWPIDTYLFWACWALGSCWRCRLLSSLRGAAGSALCAPPHSQPSCLGPQSAHSWLSAAVSKLWHLRKVTLFTITLIALYLRCSITCFLLKMSAQDSGNQVARKSHQQWGTM